MDKTFLFNKNLPYEDEIDIWLKTHNIIREKSELYYEFFTSLFELLNDTYLGIDILYKEYDIKNHYNWCFDKTISNFEKENILFNRRGEHHEYLWYFFMDAFYKNPTNERINLIYEYFNLLFDFNHVKPHYELDGFTYLYKIFDKNLKKLK